MVKEVCRFAVNLPEGSRGGQQMPTVHCHSQEILSCFEAEMSELVALWIASGRDLGRLPLTRSNKHTSLESFRNQQSGPDVKVSAASGGCPLCLPGGAAWCVACFSVNLAS
ncbi:hypothetical protein O3P69_016864 [Scylla paramamosain]|uniref:Uncharacterized protein n=1 Tax=Scylla paramamosain TaxID=85552 RepID=A0AAW0SYQ2_SCYPA